jgi:hypothetical protein
LLPPPRFFKIFESFFPNIAMPLASMLSAFVLSADALVSMVFGLVLAILLVSFCSKIVAVLFDDESAILVSLLLFADVLQDVITRINADETIGNKFKKRIFFNLKIGQKIFPWSFFLRYTWHVINYLSELFLFFLYINTLIKIIIARPIKTHIHQWFAGCGACSRNCFPGNIFKLSSP